LDETTLASFIAALLVALFGLTVIPGVVEGITSGSTDEKTSQEITKLASEINRTCDDGVDTDLSLELNQLQVKLNDDEIFSKDREEDDTEYNRVAAVSCPYKGSELVIPSSEENANALGFYTLNFEDDEDGYRRR
jgi:hypothetical protein